jgi:prephenate dehydrogenase
VNIGVIGVGLIGSSLIRALKSTAPSPSMKVYDTNKTYIDQLLRLDLGVEACADLGEIASDADIIFVCTPVSAIAKIVCALIPQVAERTVITDVGSTKAKIIRDVTAIFPDYPNYVPGHPMSGGENVGPLHGSADLFRNNPYILTPYANTSEGAIRTIHDIIEKIEGKVCRLAPDQHDRIMALVSHLPHLYAFSLMNAASEESELLGMDVLKYVGGAFTDVTRIAAADVRMWLDIFDENESALLRSYDILRNHLDSLAGAIKDHDADKVSYLLNAARTARLKLNSGALK